MRLTAKKKAEYQEIVRAWLDENGPATKEEIAIGLGWSCYDTNRVIRTRPSWLVSPGYYSERYAQIVLYHSKGEHVLGECLKCGTKNFHHAIKYRKECVKCSMGDREIVQNGFTDEELKGIDPTKPCEFGPGSQEKIMVLAKRYADGVQQLWDPRDAGFEAFGSDQPEEEWDDYDD